MPKSTSRGKVDLTDEAEVNRKSKLAPARAKEEVVSGLVQQDNSPTNNETKGKEKEILQPSFKSTSKPTSKSISKPISQPTSKPISYPLSRAIIKSTTKPITDENRSSKGENKEEAVVLEKYQLSEDSNDTSNMSVPRIVKREVVPESLKPLEKSKSAPQPTITITKVDVYDENGSRSKRKERNEDSSSATSLTGNAAATVASVPEKPKAESYLVYKVQLGAYKTRKDLSIFSGLPDVHHLSIRGLYKYYSGHFKVEQEAEEVVKLAKAKGFKEAFVVVMIKQ